MIQAQLLLIAALLAAVPSSVAPTGPDVVDLPTTRGFVRFKHAKHVDSKLACARCHGEGVAAKILGFGKDAAHALCQGCHAETGRGPRLCAECHQAGGKPGPTSGSVPKKDSLTDVAVRRAEDCVGGDKAACLRLDVAEGLGVLDLHDLPRALAGKVALTLAPMCDRNVQDACRQLAGVLVRLDRSSEALVLLRAHCETGDARGRLFCDEQVRLEIQLGRREEAAVTLGRLCDTESYEMERSCQLAGAMLEQLARPQEALRHYRRSCQAHEDNLSCDGVNRLGGAKVPAGSWQGLYLARDKDQPDRSGSLLITDLGGGRLRVRQESTGFRDAECVYRAEGDLSGTIGGGTDGVATMLAERTPEGWTCQPRLFKIGDSVEFRDPAGFCKELHCGPRGTLTWTFTRSH